MMTFILFHLFIVFAVFYESFIKFYYFLLLLILHPKGHVAHVLADVSGRQSETLKKTTVLPSFDISILYLKCFVSFCIFPRNNHGTRSSVPFSDT